MLPSNRPAPDFELPDLDGHCHHLSDYAGRIVVLNFWSADCPHVERTDASILAARERWGEDVCLLCIASNRNESDELLKQAAHRRGLPVILKDAGHVAADLYGAQVTPEVYVIDREGILRYHGAVDDVRFGRPSPTQHHLENAVDALLAGRLPQTTETQALGCFIIRET